MRKLFFLIISEFLISIIAFAVTYNSNPKIFISELVDDAIKTLSDKSITKQEKNKFIEEIAKANVDIKGIGLYTLGKIRKDLDEKIISEYHVLFEKYFLKSLISRLTDYSDQKFSVIDSTQKNAKYTIVHSKIEEGSAQPEIKIDWRVYTKNPQKPLIRDLIVEGLSLARTQKEEFASILNSNDMDINALLNKLREFVSS